ncbi:MAG: hypothetical protein WA979_08980, partial [Pacificimonas sp.]
MEELDPAPASLGLVSPALGPWFVNGSGTAALPTLAAPRADLSVAIALTANQQWHAPAGGMV